MENYYELLEVSKNASDEVISKVFKHHIKKNHPDLFSGKEKIEAEVKVQKLNEAYEILSNPEKRKEYDELLDEEEKIKNDVRDEEINNLNMEKNYLLHSIDNYNRFINEYFYEKADEVFDVINSYDADNSNNDGMSQNNNYSNVQQPQKNIGIVEKMKGYLYRAAVYCIAITLFFTVISLLFKVNVFSIIFNVLFK